MRYGKLRFATFLALLLGQSMGSHVYASAASLNENPRLNHANVYKYLKDENGTCLTLHIGCNTQHKSLRQLSKGYGFIGTTYGLNANSFQTFQLEGKNSPAAKVHKYSGATGTYTAKHYPIAIEGHHKISGKDVSRYTYFVYSGPAMGTDGEAFFIASALKGRGQSEVSNPNYFMRNYVERPVDAKNGKTPSKPSATHSNAVATYLARYDHVTKRVSSPLLIHAKWTDDPHDNAVLNKDGDGNFYVLISGRNRKRGGFFYKISPEKTGDFTAPFEAKHWNIVDLGLKNIKYTRQSTNVRDPGALDDRFVGINYPKLFWVEEKNGGYFRLIYTVYCRKRNGDAACNNSNTRQLWSAKLNTKGKMSELTLLSAVNGHYAIANSTLDGKGIMVAFNWHRPDKVMRKDKEGNNHTRYDSNVDNRTNLYVIYSTDGGSTWKTSDSKAAHVPYLTIDALKNAEIANFYQEKDTEEQHSGTHPNKLIFVKDVHLAGDASSGEFEELKPTILFVSSTNKRPTLDNDPDGNYRQDMHKMGLSFRYKGQWHNKEFSDDIDHNYSTGSIYWLGRNQYRIFFPGLKSANNRKHMSQGGYSNGLAGGVFSHLDLTLQKDQIITNNLTKSEQKKPRQQGYLNGLCEVNYIRTVHHGRVDSDFAAVMSAANPQRFEAYIGSPNNHLPAAPLFFTNQKGELFKLPMAIDHQNAEHKVEIPIVRRSVLKCQ